MSIPEFRAYDKREKNLIYNQDLWLPRSLQNIGHTVYPVHITEDGIRYRLNCLSNHYEHDWEEDVVTCYGIEIMAFTGFWDHEEPRKKIYCNDIISIIPKENSDLPSSSQTGRIIFCQGSKEWIVVDKKEHYLEKLSQVNCPRVIGNWFDNAELLE